MVCIIIELDDIFFYIVEDKSEVINDISMIGFAQIRFKVNKHIEYHKIMKMIYL
jgi:hypothetical protein